MRGASMCACQRPPWSWTPHALIMASIALPQAPAADNPTSHTSRPQGAPVTQVAAWPRPQRGTFISNVHRILTGSLTNRTRLQDDSKDGPSCPLCAAAWRSSWIRDVFLLRSVQFLFSFSPDIVRNKQSVQFSPFWKVGCDGFSLSNLAPWLLK